MFLATINLLQAQNTNLPVGVIPGVVDVSPTGAATYTIPIEVVPGTQGMQPNLSIVYNSDSGMGLLGMNWDLTGLSAISRCSENTYFDVRLCPIQFDKQVFSLDGARLLKPYHSVYEYMTEEENFMRITRSIQYDYFYARTDDGTYIEYGNSDNSRQKMASPNDNKILSWWINNITDGNGNYMTFSYDNGNYGEIVVTNISYTGNSINRLPAYASVDFHYRFIPSDLCCNTHFVDGCGITQTRLLQFITVRYNGAQVRKYQFNYNTHADSVRSPQLKEVVLYSANNVELSKTIIKWKESLIGTMLSSVPLNGSMKWVYRKGVVPGDFNGDGYMDYRCDAGCDSWVFYGKPDGGFDKTTNTYPIDIDGWNGFVCAIDLNGDGKDDFLTSYLADVTKRQFYFLNDEMLVERYCQIYLGDFDGDGSTDFLIMYQDINDNYLFKHYTFSWGKSNYSSIPMQTRPCKVSVADFNGDGKADVEIHAESGLITRYSFNAETGRFALLETQQEPYWRQRYYGDFNGDGITDMLIYQFTTNNPKWEVAFGKGNGTYTGFTPVKELNVQVENLLPKYPVIIADFDGDGKDDILQPFSEMCWIIYSKGCHTDNVYKYKFQSYSGFLFAQNPLEPHHFNITDMDNDGILDFVFHACQTPTVYSFHKNRQYDCVKSITDGMGKIVEFTYKPRTLPATDFNTAQGVIKKFAKFLVSNMKVSNGIDNQLNEYQYQYDAPAFSWRKRTFLGIREFRCKNVAEDKEELFVFKVINEDMPNSKHVLTPHTKATYYKTFVGGDGFGYKCAPIIGLEDLGNKRYAVRYNPKEIFKLLSMSTATVTILDTTGRLIENREEIQDELQGKDMFHDKKRFKNMYYTYNTTTTQTYKPKTVITKLIVTQRYKDIIPLHADTVSPLLVDTFTYGYTQGNLAWERRGNIDGAITTSYGNYDVTGVYRSKTVSAPECEARTETYEYDPTRRFITKITNPLGHITLFSYDPKTGNKLSETDPNGLTTTYTYDVFGNLTKIIYPDKPETNITTSWHSPASFPYARYTVTTKNAGQPEQTLYYDLLGREVCRKYDGCYTDTRFNTIGQIVKTSYPYKDLTKPDTAKIWTQYTYDDFGRKLTEKAPYTNLSYTYYDRKIIVNDSLRDVVSWKNYDAFNRITEALDAGGTISYHYSITQDKQYKTEIKTPDASTTIFTDLWGNKKSFVDPNAGGIAYYYNNFNELLNMGDARGNQTIYEYDKLGRVFKKGFVSNSGCGSIDYVYDTSNKGIGKLSQIKVDGFPEENFYYDNFSRLVQHTKTIGPSTYTHSYTYNTKGQLQTLTYPDGFGVTYTYTPTGKLDIIRRSNDNSLIYTAHGRNEFGALYSCEYGNGLATQYAYNPYGLITHINTGNMMFDITPGEVCEEIIRGDIRPFIVDSSILNYRYTYNDTGLMTSRSESIANRKEVYTYDNLDRLIGITLSTPWQSENVQTFSYNNNGNIKSNSLLGAYNYKTNGSKKPHAVTKIDPINNNVISASLCEVTYNYFNQPTEITDVSATLDKHWLEFTYGADQQRNQVSRYKNSWENRRDYVSQYYEYEIAKGSPNVIRHYHYIYGDDDVVALHIAESNVRNETMYYIHTDHLGSYCALTDPQKQVRQRNYFDAWGNSIKQFRRTNSRDSLVVSTEEPSGVEDSTLNFTLTARGFTGHEHYPDFKIINMNGRLYDPVIGRFFSPDNFVLDNTFTQDFNRYSYARNNPLKYTDPTGMTVVIEGEEKRSYFREVRRGAKELGFSVKMNKDGLLSAMYRGKGEISIDGQKFLDAVNSKSITIKINATNSDYIDGVPFFGGAFMGNNLNQSQRTIGKDDVIKTTNGATAYQTVNPGDLMQMDNYSNSPGMTSIHEITEPYQGALISIRNGVASGNSGDPYSVYQQAHNAATPQSVVMDFYRFDRAGNQVPRNSQNIYSVGWAFPNQGYLVKELKLRP